MGRDAIRNGAEVIMEKGRGAQVLSCLVNMQGCIKSFAYLLYVDRRA